MNTPIRIGLLSFAIDSRRPQATLAHADVLLAVLESRCDLDLLVTSGWTLWDDAELHRVRERNRNQRTVAILETWQDESGQQRHHGHAIRGSELLVHWTPQIFATSGQINGHPELAAQLLDELECRRAVTVNGRVVTWLICGEINLLANVQSEGNRCRFRFDEDAEPRARWRKVLDGTAVFVNPTHTVMGNQGKLAKRREYLSAGSRILCSASNVELAGRDGTDARRRLGHVPVQYFWQNGAPGSPEVVEHSDSHILRVIDA